MMKSSTFTFSPAHNHKCFTDQIISAVMAPTFSSVRKQKLVVKLSIPSDKYLYDNALFRAVGWSENPGVPVVIRWA